ncbi:uncharacterized protein N0V89_010145 [Didymosphaeria variabile]|uniref:RNI-like protein n=1 Tax=Didymosphaeria variabile TaxID=1932322 RepID=A0A9W8XF70_9PLEO|nr:uncharacterized protein N0V89_010145 [Didymosphaeria variabile]KAJ4348767.1 hypothetical protein N0V89_010145 [Didymosphaeria variabile]
MDANSYRKRKRAHVSYREPSSDDDFSNSDIDNPSRRKRPTRRSARHQSIEVEPEAEASTRHTQPTASAALARSAVSQRTHRRKEKRKVSYREESTDEDSDEDPEADYEPEVVVVQRKPRSKGTSQRSTPRKQSENSSRKTIAPKKRAFGAPLKEKKAPQPIVVHIPTDGIKPDMSSLPYHVLLQIFVYASHPLHDENMHATSSISWLITTAQMCHAFTKPALTALYRNPPIFAIRQNRKKLVNHLIMPPEDVRQDYQVMVKRLELDATQMSALTDPTNSLADLTSLTSALSTLKEIDIFDPLDRPPYRERLKRMRRWTYPPELFEALRQTQLRLKSWRWHSAYCAEGLLWIKDIHADQVFQSLRDVTFVKFNFDEKRKPDATDPTTEELLASAVASLPNLQSLTFESCTAVNGKLLSLLPSALLSLSITNCIYLTSDDMHTFLSDHGWHLEELVLNHNQSLDLSFLVTLKQDCPRLEVLKMDLSYYSTLAMSSDNEPLYDWLLGLDDVPTWPSTLRIIDMEHLRKWGADSATNFFTSLIDSAADLPFLRELRILAMVDMDWRQRADFRRKWAARFEKVFAWRGPAPSPHLASLRAYRQWKDSQQDAADSNDSLLDVTAEVPVVAAKEGQATDAPGSSDDETDSDVPLLAKRRLRSRAKVSTNYDETSENENEDAEGLTEDTEADDEEPTVVQGRCHTVICRIDNLRPREEMFDEADFLDEERSGDEEWDENNDDVEDSYAW